MTSAGEPTPPETPSGAVVKHPLLIIGVSAAATLALLLSVLLIWGLATYSLPGPASANGADRIVELSEGANLSEISEVLVQDKVISSASVFVLAAKLNGSARRLQAGEYSFPSKTSMSTVMEMIRKGKGVRHQVTIPEGFASDMVVDALMKSDVLTGTVSAPPEGSVMPQTYDVKRGETRAAVLERMKKAQTELVAELWPKRRSGLPFTTPEQAVILASIVEKETAKADERPRIAALFINRLQQGMRLESDPTIIYGITRGRPLGRGLRASEVDAATPYNTYVIFGLPPTPIANPGRAALEAVLTAPPSTEVFFVADGTGGHVFATSYDDHRRNVAQWRRIERQQAAAAAGGASMALSGMTGFARVEGSAGAWTWAVEARSVNGRNLETRFRGPPGFDSLERVARDGAQSLFQRGQITIGLQAKRAESVGQVRVNLDQIERYLGLVAPLIAAGRAQPPSADGLLALRGVLEVTEEVEEAEVKASVEQAMTASITDALTALQASRLDEGAALAPVLGGLVDRIEAMVTTAEAQAAGQPSAIKERFTKRMTELAGDGAGVAERIVTEAAAMAVKADVREELDRLVSHIQAARTLLSSEAASGRRLDFLMQEFMREANTLCSKSALTGLTATGLDLKATIEQLREQVQNVE